jgi:hypothetical protein
MASSCWTTSFRLILCRRGFDSTGLFAMLGMKSAGRKGFSGRAIE